MKKDLTPIDTEKIKQEALSYSNKLRDGIKLIRIIHSNARSKYKGELGLSEIEKNKLFEIKENLNLILDAVFKFTDENNYYWRFCSPKVYINHFDLFKSNFFDGLSTNNELQFLNFELEYFKQKKTKFNFNHRNQFEDIFPRFFKLFLNDKNEKKIQIYSDEKIKFIENQIKFYSLNKTYSTIESESNQNNLDNNKSEFPFNIFNDYSSFKLFEDLDENYTYKLAKTKYINIYHYLTYIGKTLICTQIEYLNYIEKTKGISISKITPKTYIYDSKEKLKLAHIESNFKKNYNF